MVRTRILLTRIDDCSLTPSGCIGWVRPRPLMSATIIEIKPQRNGWKVFEAAACESVLTPGYLTFALASEMSSEKSGTCSCSVRLSESARRISGFDPRPNGLQLPSCRTAGRGSRLHQTLHSDSSTRD